MAELDILEYLDLGSKRTKSIDSDDKITNLSDSEAVILNEVKEKDFGVDLIYFNTDEETNNSFPAVFLKKVTNFNDEETLKDIAETQRKIWNYKKVLFLYVYSETEIRIYNCSEKPLIVTKDDFDYKKELKGIEINSYQYSDKQQLQELNKLFSRIAIDTGIIWTLEDAQFIRDKINLQKRVDEYLVNSFVNTATFLEKQGLDLQLIHKVILRSLFLLYLEDRGAADKNFYNQFKENAESYLDILDDVDATYALFKKLAKHFNGNVFIIEDNEPKLNKEQLKAIKVCFIRGREKKDTKQLFDDDWRLFRLFHFGIIQIELLSEIYENFLTATSKQEKKDSGTYYTPPSLVEFILNEKLPVNNGETDYKIKILDPSCGSGIFLVESFKRIVKRYENAHNIKNLSDFDTLVQLLKTYIFGIEINPQAVTVATFSLYLALLDKLNPKDLWQDTQNYQLPYLINSLDEKDPTKIGKNIYCRDTISDLSSIDELKDFQLIVGNPPFGELLTEEKDEKGIHKHLRAYCKKEKFAKEMVLPFLHKATSFAPNGEIALIFNTKVLTNTGGTYQKFREWLFQKCYVEKVYNFSILRKVPKNFGGKLFGDAVGPISIVFYKKEQPQNPSDTIVYYAPKTYVRSNIIEGLSIDSTDIKYLPREECQKPDTKIWKVAMWGGMNDWELINRVADKFNISIGEFLKKNKEAYHFGSGLHSPSEKQLKENKTFTPSKVINLRKVQRFYTLKSAEKHSQKVYRSINQNIFKPPYLIIKEGQKNKEFCASWIDYKSCHTGAFSISSINQKNDFNLKLWCSLINSAFAKYYLSLTSASWGIERERVQANETLTLPMPTNINKNVILKLEQKFDKLIKLIQDDFDFVKTKPIESEINKIILQDLFLFSDSDKWAIDDLNNYSIDLFERQEKSNALYPVTENQPKEYAQIIAQELNEFLDGQDLFVNTTIYKVNGMESSPLMMIKLTHEKVKKEVFISDENVADELKNLDKGLWDKKATNIYFRKKLNYKKGDDIYIIRPNQRRFWSQSMALEDASELILEILNGVHDEA